ncbi:hypothetical protein WN944_000004 [Citrus x changshan-huyou]|uniref:Uncharacterized protein n=1 Tax=Citrus x changshan-huyou TaxID=2935761 RepID=A0AAP0QE71_9ROSI
MNWFPKARSRKQRRSKVIVLSIGGLVQIVMGRFLKARVTLDSDWKLRRSDVELRLSRADVARSGCSEGGHGELIAWLVCRDG